MRVLQLPSRVHEDTSPHPAELVVWPFIGRRLELRRRPLRRRRRQPRLLMLTILRITFPFFALIAVGYVSVVRRWLPRDAVGALNLFVLYIALPCMLFKFSVGLDLPTLWRQPVLAIYGLVAFSLFASLLLWGRRRGIRWR